jgi:pSer/pThr/pTyr-binding forkhead associated (FHA) protein
MDVRLVWEKSRKQKQVFNMRGEEMVIGRQLGSGLRIPSNEVSRVHCRICRETGYITIEDCASANGTLVNGEAISERKILYPGDRVKVGPVTLIVEYQMTQETLDHLRGQKEDEIEPVLLDDDDEMEVEEVEEIDDEITGEPLDEDEDELPVLPVELDDAEPWELPQPDELRDILSQLEDGDD